MGHLFLGVDTSNYTTSLALCKDGQILKHTRRLLPVKQGQGGLRQSDAVFLHTKALPELVQELFEGIDYYPKDLTAVGVSVSPRDIKGSYMPCFLAGISLAQGIASALKLPLYRFSHQAGHIQAGIYSSGFPKEYTGDFLSYHVSGGTTEILLVHQKEAGFTCELIGGTSDASAGQIIDRAGLVCGMNFPCGKALDDVSKTADKVLPVCVHVNGTSFSLSGLQNKFEAYIKDGESNANAAAFLFTSIAKALDQSCVNARARYGEHLPVLFAGGVMCNSLIRSKLAVLHDVYFASPELSKDNACGTGLLCYKAHTAKEVTVD